MPSRPAPYVARGLQGDETAHAVADNDRRLGDAGRFGDGEHLTPPGAEAVGVPAAAVAVAGQVKRRDAPVAR